MGNSCCGKPKDDKTTTANHKKARTMVSYDFDSAKGQIRAVRDFLGSDEPTPRQNSKTAPRRKLRAY